MSAVVAQPARIVNINAEPPSRKAAKHGLLIPAFLLLVIICGFDRRFYDSICKLASGVWRLFLQHPFAARYPKYGERPLLEITVGVELDIGSDPGMAYLAQRGQVARRLAGARALHRRGDHHHR